MGISYNPSIVTDGLVLCLDAANRRSYPGAGTTWTDLSGNGNNGTLTNGPTFSGANGGNIVFDGSNDYVQIPYNSTFSMQNFTLNVIISFNGFNSYNCIITNPQNGPPWSSPYLSWLLRVNSSSAFEASIGSSSSYYSSSAGYNFSTNKIYSLIATYDGSKIRSYVNSILVRTASVSLTINYTSKPILIAAGYGASPLGEYLNGKLYNINIYNRALSPQEIRQNYNATKGRYL